jgi:uncharacterized LabA/DUF88 family protein
MLHNSQNFPVGFPGRLPPCKIVALARKLKGDQLVRIACLVDGFNVYHSLSDSVDEGAPEAIKWLDLRALCESHLGAFNNKDAHFTDLVYLTSLAVYRQDNAVARHKAYIKALEAAGFQVIYGNFKDKTVRCEASCRQEYTAHVEKQTDVNLALKLLELFHLDKCDGCLIVSGDGDLLNAVKTARSLFTEKVVAVAFPYNRWNPELSKSAQIRIKLTIDDYKIHILPDPMPLGAGKVSHMPREWKV